MKIASLEKEIASKAQSFKEQLGLKKISYKEISKNLKENELYIDIAKTEEHYYLFTLDREGNVSFDKISKKESQEIDRLVSGFRKDIDCILENINQSKVLKQSSQEKLSRLYDLILSPIHKQVSRKSSLIISPDGALKLLPFEALLKGSTYLVQVKDIRYVPSGKELVRLYKFRENSSSSHDQAVIFADPRFNDKEIARLTKKDEIALTPHTSRAGIIKSLFKMRFGDLPGTKAEALAIRHTLTKKKMHIKDYEAEEANEKNLIQVDAPKILHIATHGFFINDDTVPNPMLKSGIALSGANAGAVMGNGAGIVTALKLSGLKLKGTELVVLSACETGVVDVNSTDSVSGLNKAFIQAGAKDVVLSLWSVSDQATKALMEYFYTQMQQVSSYAVALKRAKLKMIKRGMHPFFWAPFIVNGL
jgi:CHAT domain-containing protein